MGAPSSCIFRPRTASRRRSNTSPEQGKGFSSDCGWLQQNSARFEERPIGCSGCKNMETAQCQVCRRGGELKSVRSAFLKGRSHQGDDSFLELCHRLASVTDTWPELSSPLDLPLHNTLDDNVVSLSTGLPPAVEADANLTREGRLCKCPISTSPGKRLCMNLRGPTSAFAFSKLKIRPVACFLASLRRLRHYNDYIDEVINSLVGLRPESVSSVFRRCLA